MHKLIKIVLLWPADLGCYLVVMSFVIGNHVKLIYSHIFAYDELTRKPLSLV